MARAARGHRRRDRAAGRGGRGGAVRAAGPPLGPWCDWRPRRAGHHRAGRRAGGQVGLRPRPRTRPRPSRRDRARLHGRRAVTLGGRGEPAPRAARLLRVDLPHPLGRRLRGDGPAAEAVPGRRGPRHRHRALRAPCRAPARWWRAARWSAPNGRPATPARRPARWPAMWRRSPSRSATPTIPCWACPRTKARGPTARPQARHLRAGGGSSTPTRGFAASPGLARWPGCATRTCWPTRRPGWRAPTRKRPNGCAASASAWLRPGRCGAGGCPPMVPAG